MGTTIWLEKEVESWKQLLLGAPGKLPEKYTYHGGEKEKKKKKKSKHLHMLQTHASSHLRSGSDFFMPLKLLQLK